MIHLTPLFIILYVTNLTWTRTCDRFYSPTTRGHLIGKIKDAAMADPEFEFFTDFEVGFEDADPGMIAWTEAQLSYWD